MRRSHILGAAVAAAVGLMSSAGYAAVSSRGMLLAGTEAPDALGINYGDPSFYQNQAYQLNSVPGAIGGTGTWVGAFAATGSVIGSWSQASNWTPGVPNGATDQALINSSGDIAGWRIIVDQPQTVQRIDVNSEYPVNFVGPGATGVSTNILHTPAGGTLTLNQQNTFSLSPTASRFFTRGQLLDVQFDNTGNLTKEGGGDYWLTRPNTQSGGTTVKGGRLVIGEGAATLTGRPVADGGDQVLGAAGAATTLNGGALFIRTGLGTATPFSFNRPVNVGPNGGSIQFGLDNPTFAQGITGTGILDLGYTGDSFITSNAAFTGTLRLSHGVFFGVQGNGAVANADVVNMARLDIIDSLNAAPVDRLGNTKTVSQYGAEITMIGNDDFDSNETFGTLDLKGALNTIRMQPGFNRQTTLQANTLARSNGAGLFVVGQNLGSSGANATQIKFGAGATTVGGGGAAGSTNVSIIPWMHGASSASSSIINTDGQDVASLVAYSAANGVRPLDLATEYAATVSGAAATDNVRATR